jgi:hypothetical protein
VTPTRTTKNRPFRPSLTICIHVIIEELKGVSAGFRPGLPDDKPLRRKRFTAVKHSFRVIMCDIVL